MLTTKELCAKGLLLVVVAGLAACAERPAPKDAVIPGWGHVPGLLEGYIPYKELPSSLALIPPPPEVASPVFAEDEAIHKASMSLKGTPRWTQAISDANASFPHAAGTYSCALGLPITEKDTPRLYTLLRRAMTDTGVSVHEAKAAYKRTRPFVYYNEQTCTPQDEESLRRDGSYPSGHTVVGWGWALLLAELSPQQENAIFARAIAFGESRNVCNCHWHSDVVEARAVAAATVARLHAEPAFQEDMIAAKAEIEAARRQGLPPTRDCAAEAAALATPISLAQ